MDKAFHNNLLCINLLWKKLKNQSITNQQNNPSVMIEKIIVFNEKKKKEIE